MNNKVFSVGRHGKIYYGDCLEILSEIPPVDCVIADPPYMIGSISVGTGSHPGGTWADNENAAYWYAEVIRRCFACLKPDGVMFMFGNWRSVPTYIRAASLSKRPVNSLIVWDKEWVGTASNNQLRPIYEVIAMLSNDEAKIPDRCATDIIRCRWHGNMKTTEHRAEKPVDLISRLIEIKGGAPAVLDPFLGSGTTGIACERAGLTWYGIERELAYCNIASGRAEKELSRAS